jgi:hypothetical protein
MQLHTYIRTYIRTYIYTYVHTHILTYRHTDIHTYVHTYIHTHIHTYIFTYILNTTHALRVLTVHCCFAGVEKQEVLERSRRALLDAIVGVVMAAGSVDKSSVVVFTIAIARHHSVRCHCHAQLVFSAAACGHDVKWSTVQPLPD